VHDNIYIVLGIKSNLEMMYSMWEGVHRLYANTVSFHIRNLSTREFWLLWILVSIGMRGLFPVPLIHGYPRMSVFPNLTMNNCHSNEPSKDFPASPTQSLDLSVTQ
jgi:hypothetical protein